MMDKKKTSVSATAKKPKKRLLTYFIIVPSLLGLTNIGLAFYKAPVKKLPLTPADLTITNAAFSVVNDVNALTYTIKNIGGSAIGSFDVHFNWMDSAPANSMSCGPSVLSSVVTVAQPLGAGQTLSDFGLYYLDAQIKNPPPGAKYLCLSVNLTSPPTRDDPLFKTWQWHNNYKTLALPCPDLILNSASIIPTTGKLTLSVKNSGTKKSNAFNIRYDWLNTGGASLGSTTQDYTTTTSPGASRQLSAGYTVQNFLTYNVPSEATTLKLTITAKDPDFEINISNNTLSIPRPLADLVPQNVSLQTIGGVLTLSGNIKNQGIAPVVIKSTIRYSWLNAYGNSLSQIDADAPAIDVGQSASLPTLSGGSFWTPPAGAVQLRITADYSNIVKESNENNNIATVNKP